LFLTLLGSPTAWAEPDLTVLELKQLPPNAQVNTGEISVKISNLGSGTTWFIKLDVAFYIDGYLCDTFALVGGLGGESSSEKVSGNCNPATPGPHSIQVVVDYTNEVEESNESNNSIAATFLWYDADLCGPSEECNGEDDNCNGQIDEDFFALGQPCDGADEDSCEQGIYVCNSLGNGITCDEPTGIQTELCNQVDDDCDGTTDEGFEEVGSPCVEQASGCTIEGLWECANTGLSVTCVGLPVSGGELCNHMDDDCDGSTDEDYPFVGSICLEGTGLCRKAGVNNCIGGTAQCGALPGFPPTPNELCGNREDDNCNGVFDEGCACVPGSYVPCGSSVGACSLGFIACSEDNTLSEKCAGAVLPVEEVCANDLDDDCDGSVDEGCTCVSGFVRPCTPGTGVCASGNQTCLSGTWGLCTLDQLASEEACDSVDNDCDGFRDEGCPCFPGDILLCEKQKDACATYYSICMETFNWSPCLAKPGTDDPLCGEEPEDTGESSPDVEEDTLSEPTKDTESHSPPDSFSPWPSDAQGGEGGTTPQIIVIQKEGAGCKTGYPSTPWSLGWLVLSLVLLWGNQRRKTEFTET
jgi:hypothetical protein